MNVVLVHREYAFIITYHLRNIGTTAPVGYLEALINSTAIFNRNRTGTDDKAPSIEICTTVDCNSASLFHFNHTYRLCRSRQAATCSLHSGNANGTVNRNISTGRHCECAIRCRLRIRILGCTGRCSIQRICIIKRNKQCNTCRNGVIACGQSSAICYNNETLCIRHCIFQIIIKGSAVHQEPCYILSKYRLNRHIIYRFQCVTCIFCDNRIVSRIDPTKESYTALRGSYYISTIFRNFYNITVCNILAVNSNTTQCTVKFKCNIRFGLGCGNSKVFHYQLIGSTVFSGCNGDGETYACIQNLAKTTGRTRIYRAINFQFINRRRCPIKRDGCSIAGFIVYGNCRSFSRGTHQTTQNTGRALCSNRNGTTGHTVITCAADFNRNTCNR